MPPLCNDNISREAVQKRFGPRPGRGAEAIDDRIFGQDLFLGTPQPTHHRVGITARVRKRRRFVPGRRERTTESGGMGGHTPGPWRLRPYQNDSHHLSGRQFGTRYDQRFT